MSDNPKELSPLQRVVNNHYGGRSFPTERTVNVTNARTRLVANNPNRVLWRVINEGANDIRVSIDPTLSPTSGWLLQRGGGTIQLYWEEDGESVGYEAFAICSVPGPTVVRVFEVMIQ